MAEYGYKLTKWSLGTTPSLEQVKTLLDNEGLQGYQWSNAPGDRYGAHSHPFYKVIYVIQGSITFDLAEESEQVHMEAGDRLDLPPGVVHSVLVGPQGVLCLEAHVTK